MKYRVPRLSPDPPTELWITDLGDAPLMRIETVPHGNAFGVVLRDCENTPLAAVTVRRGPFKTTAEVEVAGEPFAQLRLKRGAVRVRTRTGDYIIAGDFAAFDFHVLLNTSPVADIAPRQTEHHTYLLETSDHESQAPLIAMVLAVDLLLQTRR